MLKNFSGGTQPPQPSHGAPGTASLPAPTTLDSSSTAQVQQQTRTLLPSILPCSSLLFRWHLKLRKPKSSAKLCKAPAPPTPTKASSKEGAGSLALFAFFINPIWAFLVWPWQFSRLCHCTVPALAQQKRPSRAFSRGQSSGSSTTLNPVTGTLRNPRSPEDRQCFLQNLI